MVVMGVTRPAIGSVAARRRGTDRRSFGITAEAAAQTEGPVASAGVAPASLLALQEAESGLQHDREAKRHGTAVIDELMELQRALLGQGEPDLEQLAILVSRPITAADPGLAGVLRAVRLRAGIELARRGYAAAM